MHPTDELYYQYASVIESVAKKYAMACPDIDTDKNLYDDLVAQANYVFCLSCLSYDPDYRTPDGRKASFETWLRDNLKSLTRVLDKRMHGPCALRGCDNPRWELETEIFAEQNKSEDKSKRVEEFTETSSSWYLSGYGKALDMGNECREYPKDMQPYIDALKGDPLTIFKDFCSEIVAKESAKSLSRTERNRLNSLNPKKLYLRHYKDIGWSLARVRTAWKVVRRVFWNYLYGYDPDFDYPAMSRASNKAGTPRKESRSSMWYHGFKERYGITYGVYRSLKNKGVIPSLEDCPDMDLSAYALATT